MMINTKKKKARNASLEWYLSTTLKEMKEWTMQTCRKKHSSRETDSSWGRNIPVVFQEASASVHCKREEGHRAWICGMARAQTWSCIVRTLAFMHRDTVNHSRFLSRVMTWTNVFLKWRVDYFRKTKGWNRVTKNNNEQIGVWDADIITQVQDSFFF